MTNVVLVIPLANIFTNLNFVFLQDTALKHCSLRLGRSAHPRAFFLALKNFIQITYIYYTQIQNWKLDGRSVKWFSLECNVQDTSHLVWFCITTLHNCLEKIMALCHLIFSKTKTTFTSRFTSRFTSGFTSDLTLRFTSLHVMLDVTLHVSSLVSLGPFSLTRVIENHHHQVSPHQ